MEQHNDEIAIAVDSQGVGADTKKKINELHEAISEARKQFEQGSEDLRKQIIIWSVISFSILIGAIGFSSHLLDFKPPETWTWQIIYYSLVRITILSALWSLTWYCLKMLSSHVYMFQYNKHRERITNSMSSFVQLDIVDKEKKLELMEKFLDNILDFGYTGIIKEEKSKNGEDSSVSDAAIKLLMKFQEKDKK